MANMWHELRTWLDDNKVYVGYQLVTDKMKEIEKKACMRDMMVQYILEPPEGSIEWAVREAIRGGTVWHDEGTLHRTLEGGPLPNMLYLQQHRGASFAGHIALLPKTGWYAEKRINTPIWSEF